MESNSICYHKSDNKIGRPRTGHEFITTMITDRIGRHEVILPINHKYDNFQKQKNSPVMKEIKGKIYIKKTVKGNLNIIRPLRLLLVIRFQIDKSKRACTHARDHNFECDWLI